MLYNRVNATDTSRGLLIIIIVFLNFLSNNSLPLWPPAEANNAFLISLGGIVFPAFIFLYCITIPFNITRRLNEGESAYEISRFIFARSIILITVGVLLVNSLRVDPEETGLSRPLWSLILIISIFLVWNRYPDKESNFFTTTGLRLAGLAALVFLVFKFRSGSFENNGSLIPGWWELPGLAGWAWLIGSFAYLLTRNSLTGTGLILAFFIALNILNYYDYTGFLDPVKPYFGVITDGYIPFIGLSGILTGIITRKFSLEHNKTAALSIGLYGLVNIAAGIVLLRAFFPDGVYGNPAWALIAAGSATLSFSILFFLDDILNALSFLSFLRRIGENMISVYLLPVFFLSLSFAVNLDIFFFRAYNNLLISLLASGVFTALIMLIHFLLLRTGIRLKF